MATGGAPAPSKTLRFGEFELDLTRQTLSRRGIRLKLQNQPYRVLVLLIQRAPQVVSRDEIRRHVWGDNVFIDVERNINFCVRQIRGVLLDDAAVPRFIQTLPRDGYRFIASLHDDRQPSSDTSTAPIESVDPIALLMPEAALPTSDVPDLPDRHPAEDRLSRRSVLLTIAGTAALLTVAWAVRSLPIMRERKVAPLTAMHRITSDGGLTEEPAVSPDGTLLTYGSDRDGRGHLSIWVQQLTGGNPIRLTTSDADDHQPSFSPDGTQVVFRSERAGGGIYVVPSFGGEPKLISKDGRDPRFSPNGKWIAYWAGNQTYDYNVGQVFIVPSSGGTPEPLTIGRKVGYPIWSPDGEHLLVLGGNSYGLDETDWWVVDRDGHASERTGAFKLLQGKGFPVLDVVGGYLPRAMQWSGNDIVFSLRSGDSVNIWSIPISPNSWRVSGTPRQLTAGHTIADHPNLLTGDQVLFGALASNSNLWSLPINANEGKPLKNGLNRLTDKASLERFGSISMDGRYLVYTSTRSGNAHVWVKDLTTGEESRVSRSDDTEERPDISRDGTMIAYSNEPGGVVVASRLSSFPMLVCERCGWVWDWSPDNRTFLYNDLHPVWGVGSFDLKTKKESTILANTKWPLYQARFSPDGKWLAFGEEINDFTSRLFITRLHNGIGGSEAEWIPIADSSGWCDKPRWSPDGKLIYFISHRDGYRCLWAQRIAGDTRRPLGEPFSVAHFHSARLSMMNIGTGFLEIDVARNKAIFNLSELTGNIWLASDK